MPITDYAVAAACMLSVLGAAPLVVSSTPSCMEREQLVIAHSLSLGGRCSTVVSTKPAPMTPPVSARLALGDLPGRERP